jgi:hypothetical protein
MKKSIRALLVILGLVCFSTQTQAQKVKVIDKSEKKKPDWVNSLAPGYIITTSSNKTLEDAKQKALVKVKEQIVSSVADNIQTSSEYFRSENTSNNNSEFKESFQTATKTRAADIPFIKGISLTNVAASYWEQLKEGDNTKFYYHMKYPFSKEQLQTLIKEYEKADKALTDQLNAILSRIPTLNNLEEMGQTVKELEALAGGFIDVDPRKDKANVGIAKLKEILRNFSIETVNNTLGEIRLVLKAGDKTVTTSRKPKVNSNCAKIVDVRNKKPEWVITYSYDECYEDPDNLIKVAFMSAYGRAKSEFFFNISAEKIDIFVNNDINISGGNDSGADVADTKCLISLTSKYATAFEIEKVILNFGKEAPIIIDGINKTFEGEGKHDLDFTISQALTKEIYSSKANPMIKGTIHYKSVKTGEKSIYKMYNQKVTTGW